MHTTKPTSTFIHTHHVPRKSIVKEIIDEHPLWETEVKTSWSYYLIFYGFKGNPSHRFYKALEELRESIQVDHPRKGVLSVMRINDAYTVSRLIAHYKGWVNVVRAGAFDYEHVFDEYR